MLISGRFDHVLTSVAMLEVQADLTRVEDHASSYGEGGFPFDYVWFTPRANDRDHCEELRKMFGKKPKPTT